MNKKEGLSCPRKRACFKFPQKYVDTFLSNVKREKNHASRFTFHASRITFSKCQLFSETCPNLYIRTFSTGQADIQLLWDYSRSDYHLFRRLKRHFWDDYLYFKKLFETLK